VDGCVVGGLVVRALRCFATSESVEVEARPLFFLSPSKI
jgi:hypothetical protein